MCINLFICILQTKKNRVSNEIVSLSNTLVNSNLAFSASDILNLQENGVNQFGKQRKKASEWEIWYCITYTCMRDRERHVNVNTCIHKT